MRTAARLDANQGAVVDALRSIPRVSVVSTAALGNGFPDLLVGYRSRCPCCGEWGRRNRLLEVKDGDKPPSRQRLTASEKEFHDTFNGDVITITSPAQAVAVVLGEER